MQVNEIWPVQIVKCMYKIKVKNRHIMKYYPVQNKKNMIL